MAKPKTLIFSKLECKFSKHCSMQKISEQDTYRIMPQMHAITPLSIAIFEAVQIALVRQSRLEKIGLNLDDSRGNKVANKLCVH